MENGALWKHEPIQNAIHRITALFGGDNKDLWPWWDGMHNGLDFAGVEGEPVFAVRDGRVFELRNDPDGYGIYLKLGDSRNHVLYAHLSGYAVKEGDMVKAGDVIGFVGNTGNSTAPHLHIGMRVPAIPRRGDMDGWINPLPYLWRLITQHKGTTLSDHWNAYHRSDYDVEALQRWQPPVIKLLKRSYDDMEALHAAVKVAIHTGAILILRAWEISERQDELFNDPEGLGEWYADWWRDEIDRLEADYADYLERLQQQGENVDGYYFPRHLVAVEGINEPHEWYFGTDKDSQERGAKIISAHNVAFIRRAVRYSLLPSVTNYGVGWTGNGGVPGLTPHWYLLDQMAEALVQFGGLSATHEYLAATKEDGRIKVDYQLGWWIGRYQSQYQYADAWHYVFKVISETGVDNGVIGREKEGWRNAGLSESEYMDILKGLDRFYRADKTILGACIFTRDGVEENWNGFDIRGRDMMEKIIEYAEYCSSSQPEPPDPDPTPPDDELADIKRRLERLERWAASFGG